MTMMQHKAPAEATVPPLLWSYDLAPVTNRMEREGVHDAHLREDEFRKFAALRYLYPHQDLAPSAKVDEFWHYFLLSTESYRNFSSQVFGHYVDHRPDDAGRGMALEYAATLALYRTHFGEPDEVLWDSPGNSMGPKRS